jgi:hypothetical protein
LDASHAGTIGKACVARVKTDDALISKVGGIVSEVIGIVAAKTAAVVSGTAVKAVIDVTFEALSIKLRLQITRTDITAAICATIIAVGHVT